MLRLHPRLTASTATRRRVGSWRSGYSVRAEWPDATHTLAGFHTTHTAARRHLDRIAGAWRPRPIAGSFWAPTNLTVVTVSRPDWRLHARRRDCRSPDCPTSTGRTCRTGSLRPAAPARACFEAVPVPLGAVVFAGVLTSAACDDLGEGQSTLGRGGPRTSSASTMV